MKNYKNRGVFLTTMLLIISVLQIHPQNEFYTDKLFGKEFLFTPDETKICIKFSSSANTL